MIEMSSKTRKKIRAGETDSLNKNMPRIAAPSAPIPTQIAYAVPIGRFWLARARKYILKARVTIVKIDGVSFEKP
jgi:hypothetical protein